MADPTPSPMNMLDVADIAASAYNPSALTHLPRPVPKDLPHGFDSSVFTFNDAFEDLLEVSRGNALPSIKSRYDQSCLLKRMYPDGEPTWFWIQRLQSQGLVDVPSPWIQPMISGANWDRLHRELEQKAGDVWRNLRSAWDAESQKHPTSESEKPKPSEGWWGDRESIKFSEDEKKGPNDFDELFSWVQSGVKQAESGFNTFVKTLDGRGPQGNTEDPNTRRVETTDEHVDRFGYLHTTRKVKIIDSDGKEIGTEIYKTIKPANTKDDDAKDGSSSSKDKDRSSSIWGK